MAARAIGSGTISFGLVAIPIKLYSTVDTTKAIRFNYLSKDGSRLKQQYVRASDGEVIERDDRVQGYEFAKGQYVLFTEDEIKAMHVEATNSIDITEFIPLEQVERVYIEKVYYLGPDKGAARSYHLLKAALQNTQRAALAKYAARGRSHLVLIRPYTEGDDAGLIMEQLKHNEELRPFAEVPLEPCEIKPDELELALTIIDQRVNEQFEPERFEDEVRSRMMERIQQKIDGQEISTPPEEAVESKIVDLMEALQASVETNTKRQSRSKKGPKPAQRAGKRAAAKQAGKKAAAKTPGRSRKL
ncbi:MAG: Ku protein [Gammaproteobacteria bacterium]|nr:Ku protein [Gammaproteobacteria bacterium]